MRVTGSSCKPHEHPPRPTMTSHLYRHMKFLPKPTTETPLERYTGVGKLETYIEHTKQEIANNLPTIINPSPPNLSPPQHAALTKLHRASSTLTIKPADKNLGIVLMNTDDYITQCLLHLTDTSTYRPTTHYPREEIRKHLHNLIINSKEHFSKALYKYLNEGPKKPRTPQFNGIPKMHKQCNNLPPMRPIVSQSSSLLSPSAQLIDHILQPLACSYPDYIQNSTSLLLRLEDIEVPDNAILVTVDVSNLYPSIPQSECLNTIHTEMHKHTHLLTFEPNIITQLLHLNINYNYFTFGNHFFQQVKGTAMGAAFSPTVANIFMSTIIRSFLHTQPIQPLIFARYIDDIFLIWTNTRETLASFLQNLNNFHPNLHFTHESSTTSINFLDLTIYKGPNFLYTNKLDSKTYQKPLNLYQYLHFTSAHHSHIFKSIIRGECVRYVRTNTTRESYQATLHMFKQRLLKRGYPNAFIDKMVNSITYSHRHKYLQCNQSPPPTCIPPLFKCIPPPQYKLLKQIILQDYAQLQFISPRFVTLRHPTLLICLVRARLNPTDNQFIDITLTLQAPSTEHVENARFPKFTHNQTLITPCKHSHCLTCRYHLLCTSTFHSTHPRNHTTYRIRHHLTCKSTNVVYLITCTKCRKQYVGYTTQQLNTRMNHHRTNIMNRARTHIATHFSSPGHILNLHLKIQPIDTAVNTNQTLQELYRLECYWITTLRTLTPHGLNISAGNTHI